MSTTDPSLGVKLPNGSPALNADRIMVQKMWANHIHETHEIIIAGMGHPTFYIAKDICEVSIKLWKSVTEIIRTVSKEPQNPPELISAASIAASRKEKQKEFEGKKNTLEKGKAEQQRAIFKDSILKLVFETAQTEAHEEEVATPKISVEWLEPEESREAEALRKVERFIRPSQLKMAHSLNAYYGLVNPEMQIKPHHIRFLAGGAGGLHIIFKLINQNSQNYILTQSPFYTLYIGHHNENKLRTIDVMDEPDHNLTAQAIKTRYEEVEREIAKTGGKIAAMLICNPNNPMGTVLSKTEWENIIDFFIQYRDCKIIVDEAYDELRHRKSYALLSIIDKMATKIKYKIIEEQQKELERRKAQESENEVTRTRSSPDIPVKKGQEKISIVKRSQSLHDFPVPQESKKKLEKLILEKEESQAIQKILVEVKKTEPEVTNAQIRLLKEALKNLASFKKRCIFIRSGTKGMSASGERYCAIIAFDSDLRKQLSKLIISNRNQLPYSSQEAYAQGMQGFAIDRMQSKSTIFSHCLSHYPWKFYYIMTENFIQSLRGIGITAKSPELPFYLNIDFGFLKGHQVKNEEILGKMAAAGLLLQDNKLMTDVEIAFFLMFAHGLFITPLSYFSQKYHQTSLLRITATLGQKTLNAILEKLKSIMKDPDKLTIKPLSSKIDRDVAPSLVDDSSSTTDHCNFTPLELFSLEMEKYWQTLNTRSTKAHNYLYEYIKDSIKKVIPIIDSYIVKQITKAIECLMPGGDSPQKKEFKLASECSSELQAFFSKNAIEDLTTELQEFYGSSAFLQISRFTYVKF